MADKSTPDLFDWEDPVAMERRIFYLMCALNLAAVLVSAPWLPWRITTGLALGGMLAWLNYRWLSRSIAAAFGNAGSGTKANLKITKFVLRYFVVLVIIWSFYALNWVSVLAALIAMTSFALAAMFESLIQMIFIVLHKEGNRS